MSKDRATKEILNSPINNYLSYLIQQRILNNENDNLLSKNDKCQLKTENDCLYNKIVNNHSNIINNNNSLKPDNRED